MQNKDVWALSKPDRIRLISFYFHLGKNLLFAVISIGLGTVARYASHLDRPKFQAWLIEMFDSSKVCNFKISLPLYFNLNKANNQIVSI